MWRLNPITRDRLRRFRGLRRGYYSFLALSLMILFSLLAELFINNRALVVSYNDRLYFPTYGAIIPGETFGLDYSYETNYRDLQKKLAAAGKGDFVLMPFIPFNPYENDLKEGSYPPFPPSLADQHFLGTDNTGRDLVARLIYGFRTAILFSLGLLLINYAIGVVVGCAMGYFGGTFDILGQRVIEIWSNIPFLYVVMIVSSILIPSFGMLLMIMVFFGWMEMTSYLRTLTYKEKARDYATAAKAVGGKPTRIMFRHILPNTVSIIITFIPFSIASGISSLTGLDFLGYGLPPPTPSWGELLNQGVTNLNAVWIVASVVTAVVVVLTLVTFIGEAIREAFDTRKHTVYR